MIHVKCIILGFLYLQGKIQFSETVQLWGGVKWEGNITALSV